MARNKPIFDADIIINMIKTNSIDYFCKYFEQVYISDYVFDVELKEGSLVKAKVKKLVNKKKIKVLYRSDLTPKQAKIYKEAYELLKDETYLEMINEGERITASYASAHRVYYYMSDDNKAAPYIKSLTSVEVINFCDLLFISSQLKKEEIKEQNDLYNQYVDIFNLDSIPKRLRYRDGSILPFHW